MKKPKREKPAATINIDTDKKCKGCGQGGATQNGYCLPCVSAGIGAQLRRARQPNLPNAEPELDAVGRAAQKFQRVVADLEDLKELKTLAETGLIGALRDAGRRSIRLGTLTLTLTHKDAVDKISVKKGTR